eukprot:1159805-Pelagomonas_calceolata.AAC.10
MQRSQTLLFFWSRVNYFFIVNLLLTGVQSEDIKKTEGDMKKETKTPWLPTGLLLASEVFCTKVSSKASKRHLNDFVVGAFKLFELHT